MADREYRRIFWQDVEEPPDLALRRVAAATSIQLSYGRALPAYRTLGLPWIREPGVFSLAPLLTRARPRAAGESPPSRIE
jgi:hypothetical protein